MFNAISILISYYDLKLYKLKQISNHFYLKFSFYFVLLVINICDSLLKHYAIIYFINLISDKFELYEYY